MDLVMAAASIRDGGLPPSLCPKCGERPRISSRQHRQPYCRECYNADRRARNIRKHRAAVCQKCGAPRPDRKTECVRCATNRTARLGEALVRELFHGYADVLASVLPESERVRIFYNFYKNKSARNFPPPSQLFAGLDPALDHRLRRDRRDKDVALCQALAAVPAPDQREFLDLYLVDPADARHWAALPRWKRPVRKGDKDDVEVWKFFTMQRLNMEQAARDAAPWAMESQGAQLPQMFGAVDRLSPAGVKKLCLVMSTYGTTLQYGRELGNVVKKPWEEKP